MALLLSFDLDNTLYDNTPILTEAENLCLNLLNEYRQKAGDAPLTLDDWGKIRINIKNADPLACENLSELRKRCLITALLPLPEKERVHCVEYIMNQFITTRSQVNLQEPVENMLKYLAERATLVAITNGNLNFSSLDWSRYFAAYYSPVMGYRAKPHPQMLEVAASEHKFAISQLIHIGDSIAFDQQAALRAGSRFVHFAPFEDKQNSLESQCQELLKKLAILKQTLDD
jgi:putative hydrolase of the HAD superfamily